MLLPPPWDFVLLAAAALAGTCGLAAVTRQRRSRWLAFATLAVGLALAWFAIEQAGRRAAREIERLVGAMAPTYARELELMDHAALPLDVAADDPRYLAIIAAQMRWLEVNPRVADIYTFRKLPDGRIVLLVDSETDYDHDGRFAGEREARTPVGEAYDAEIPGLGRAFAGEAVFESVPVSDRWGTWVSAFVPLRDRTGAVEAVVGVDYDAGYWLRAIARARWAAVAVAAALLGVALTAVAAVARARRDAGELERRNRELQRARDEALEASRAKSGFLAAVSHELRTPLHVFLGMNELLLASDLDDRQRRHAATAQRAAEGLLTMVGDLLDFAQLEAGKLTLDEGAFDLAAALRDALDSHRETAAQHGLGLVLERDFAEPAWVLGDCRRLRQILRHLISNALKCTEHGEVKVRARLVPEVPEGILLDLVVEDTGVGVPPGQGEAIFERFNQLDSSNTRRHGGLGIGLALSRALARRMGGTLELESPPAGGALFRLVVPLRAEESTPSAS